MFHGSACQSLLTNQLVANLAMRELAFLATVVRCLATATCHQLLVRVIAKGTIATCSGLQILQYVRFLDAQFVSGLLAGLVGLSRQLYGAGH